MNVLIVKMWALGDILMATPLLRNLKKLYPDCTITWLADKYYADVLEGNPYLDELIAFDSGAWRRLFRRGKLPSYLKMSSDLRARLKERHFDIVINLTAEKWWSIWFMVAPRRVGVFPRPRAGLMGRLYTDVVERSRDPWLHNSRHYLLAAAVLGVEGPCDERMVVGVTDAERNDVTAFLSSDPAFDPAKPIIVLHPGTSQASKCWPPKQYAALARRLEGYNVAITGSSAERDLAQSIAHVAGRPVIAAAGSLARIGQTAALIECAAAVVTGDTSVLHIASALDVPIVGIYGSTRPGDNAPLFGRSELLYDDSVSCAPCYQGECRWRGPERMSCMRNVDAPRVLKALSDLGLAIEAPVVGISTNYKTADRENHGVRSAE